MYPANEDYSEVCKPKDKIIYKEMHFKRTTDQ